jgi:predicted ABC-type ATPase
MTYKKRYVIAGCNGAGKTTASFTILPEILDCKEFINADEIARGISPFQPEKVSFEAGRIMLNRINELLYKSENPEAIERRYLREQKIYQLRRETQTFSE